MAAQNLLIAGLPRPDRQRLLAAAESVPLTIGQVLAVQGETLQQVYLPVDGAISMTVQADAHPCLEVGLIGREGMLGAHWLLGVGTAPTHAIVQNAGTAWRLESHELLAEMGASEALRSRIGRYLMVRIEQMALAVACRRFHAIAPRLARWLLMCQDRTQADPIRITHELLAQILGVRRVGITLAAGELQRRGLISYHRGSLTVLDRAALEASACSCYARDRRSYAKRMA